MGYYSNEIIKNIDKLKIISGINNRNYYINNIEFNSKIVKQNDLFICINTGSLYVKEAIEKGAICIIISESDGNINDVLKIKNINIIIVKDIIKTLIDIAKYNRKRLKKAKIIGITGSIGKTTTRILISDICKRNGKTTSPIKNYNNIIGLSYTIANADIDSDYIVLELGMNHIGEIKELTKIAKPDIAIITTIQPAHIGNFTGIGDIVIAKAEIFQGMNENGIVILDKGSEYYNELVNIAEKNNIRNIIPIGKNTDYYVDNIELCNNYSTNYEVLFCNGKKRECVKCNISGISKKRCYNSLFAFVVAKQLGFNIKKTADIIKKSSIFDGRGDIEKIKIDDKMIEIINDAYNASPSSMKEAIISLDEWLNIQENKKSIFVIGDMLELGENAKQYHIDISHIILECRNIKNIVCVGEYCYEIYSILKKYKNFTCYHFYNVEELNKSILEIIKDYDIVEFKASRSIGLEKSIQLLKGNNN